MHLLEFAVEGTDVDPAPVADVSPFGVTAKLMAVTGQESEHHELR